MFSENGENRHLSAYDWLVCLIIDELSFLKSFR